MDRSTSYSHLRKHLKEEFDKVCNNSEVLQITRKNGENVVVLSEADYNSLKETLHLMRSPAMHKVIIDGLNTPEGLPLDAILKEYE